MTNEIGQNQKSVTSSNNFGFFQFTEENEMKKRGVEDMESMIELEKIIRRQAKISK